ncbi:hypothetical protein EU803_08220 [Loktanella sp. IMCC34160]|uniref:hypothetical protein n=1 Tax=Loktanella sp. IMCC34160 TaxID=2510646 RepID=UPI00101C69DB|nr:hypothetical protein [Loktanella sp. IMCC34160]RYG91078.1 hypothetical protein EU803_08220 [Loktanella sp. IMCC34160]
MRITNKNVSLVFRDKDKRSTSKVYINDLDAAARLAARYRVASHQVDVIDALDRVAFRWEVGSPDWQPGDARHSFLDIEAYRFRRLGDPFWEPESRLRLLNDALGFAFDTATGNADEEDLEGLIVRTEQGGDDIWSLIREARIVAETADGQPSSTLWEQTIAEWMSDASWHFVEYVVEHNALASYLRLFDIESRVPRLGVELANLAATRG